MWESEVGPRLRALNPGVAIATRTLKTFGITEGGLDEMLSDLFSSANPTLGIYSKPDGIHLRAIATAPTEPEARALIEPMESDIRKTVGHAIWGQDEDTPVTAALDALKSKELTLAIAEGFTGGLISSTLLESNAASGILAGSVVLSPDSSSSGPLGVDGLSETSPTPSDAKRLASAVRAMFGADVGLAVTSLTTEPTEASGSVGTTHIGIAVGDRSYVSSGSYPTRRLRIRTRAVTHALLELARVISTGSGGQEESWG
jgi:nicotinamide-nucleotide amidase